jgi:molecular chaperone GrpE
LSEEDPTDEPESPEGSGTRPEEATLEPVEGAVSLAEALEPAPDAGVAGEAFHQRARLAEDRLAEVLAAYRTMRTENEGFRDRLSRNLERRFAQRREHLLLKFIDILDSLDRALEAAEQTFAGDPLIEGLILVRAQLLQTLKDEGLERIPAIGMAYDPNHSEAVETRAVEDPDQHHLVVKELLRGYRLNGRVARASRVIVGEYPQGAPGEAPAASFHAPPSVAEPMPVEDEIEAPSEPSLEDIVSRAEAQEALFPGAFEDEPDKSKA